MKNPALKDGVSKQAQTSKQGKNMDQKEYLELIHKRHTKELNESLNTQWSAEKIKVILDLISFLTNDIMASNNVKTLETIMENTDPNSEKIISNC